MRIGINAGFGDPIKPDLPFIARVGFTVVRQDLAAIPLDEARLTMLMEEFVGEPLTPLFLLAGGKIERPDHSRRVEPHEIAALGSTVIRVARQIGLADYAVEIGNEPDLANEGYAGRPQDFAVAVTQTRNRMRDEGFTGTIVSGGASNLNRRGFAYLERLLAPEGFQFPADVVIGFHRYPESAGDHNTPHAGYASRDDEMRRLRDIVGNRPIACTEFGYHTALDGGFLRQVRRTDAQVAVSVMFDVDFYDHYGCELAVLFQLNDGPRDIAEHRYGIRTEASPKLVAEAIEARFGSTSPPGSTNPSG